MSNREYRTPVECLLNHASGCDDWKPQPEEIELVDRCLGHFYRDGEDSYQHVFVFDAEVTDDEARRIASLMGFDPYERHCSHSHDCCGCWFGPDMEVYPPSEHHRIGVIGRSRNV